jgi:SAM-dependent methyltransferase
MTTQAEGALPYPKHDYHDYPKSLPRTAFWAQVRRTVAGKPVPEEQITLIHEQIATKLELRTDDVLLDLACGNGALSARLLSRCGQLVGVDHSAYLVGIALEHFHRPPRTAFLVEEAGNYCRTTPDAAKFTKALCYGSFSYFSVREASVVLEALFGRFGNLSRVLIGNLPDRSRAPEYYASRAIEPDDLDSHETQFGIWWDRLKLSDLARRSGWHATVCTMPANFYAAAYRFDLLLTRRP